MVFFQYLNFIILIIYKFMDNILTQNIPNTLIFQPYEIILDLADFSISSEHTYEISVTNNSFEELEINCSVNEQLAPIILIAPEFHKFKLNTKQVRRVKFLINREKMSENIVDWLLVNIKDSIQYKLPIVIIVQKLNEYSQNN